MVSYFATVLFVQLCRCRCCKRRTGYEDARWRVQNYFVATFLFVLLVGFVAPASMIALEVYRETHDESGMSRAETGLPQLFGMFVVLVACIEMPIAMCRINSLLRQAHEENGVATRLTSPTATSLEDTLQADLNGAHL